jgi:hypothetical protein
MSGIFIKVGMPNCLKSGDLAFLLIKNAHYHFRFRYKLSFKVYHSINDRIKVAMVSKFIMGNSRIDMK